MNSSAQASLRIHPLNSGRFALDEQVGSAAWLIRRFRARSIRNAASPAHQAVKGIGRPRVVIVGAGFGGIEAAKALLGVPVDVIVIDRQNHHCFQPLLYQVATARILPALSEELSQYADEALRKLGVEVRTSSPVINCRSDGVEFGGGFLRVGTIVWAAGVAASPAAEWTGAPRDRAGRVLVNPDLSVPGAPTVFIVGDEAAANWTPGRLVPGLAAAAKQMGRYVGTRISTRIRGDPFTAEFHYRYQGDLATIGRRAAVVKLKHLELTSLLGGLFWSLAHIYFLIGVRSRFAVAFNWARQYVTFQRGARLITGVDAKRGVVASRGGIQPHMRGRTCKR